MATPSISVVLPYFNAEQTLAQAIQSILDQTFTDFELLLINNNSSDGSEEIAKSLAQRDQRIKLLSEPNQGVVFAANLGMTSARGRYIARMDADDIALPDRLKLQFHHLERNHQVALCATQVEYVPLEKDTPFEHFVQWSNKLLTTTQISTNRLIEFPVVNPTLIFRKELLNDVGLFSEGDFPEDYEWFLRALNLGHQCQKIEQVLLKWRDLPDRLTRSDTRYRTEAFFKMKTHFIADYLHQKKIDKVWIWGAGKLGYKRSQWLIDFGLLISGYIDIKVNKTLPHYPVINYQKACLKDQPFIISYVSNRNKREEVRAFLNKKGYSEGDNYLIVA